METKNDSERSQWGIFESSTSETELIEGENVRVSLLPSIAVKSFKSNQQVAPMCILKSYSSPNFVIESIKAFFLPGKVYN